MNSLKRQLLWIFSIISMCIAIWGYFYHATQRVHYDENLEDELNVIADLKKSQILDWRNNLIENMEHITNNPLLRDDIQLQLSNRTKSATIQSWLDKMNTTHEYDGLFLFDATGTVRMRSDGRKNWPDQELRRAFESSANTKQVYLSDLFNDSSLGGNAESIRMVVAAPIFLNDDGHVISVVAAIISPYKKLYPLIQTWPLPSQSAEILMVRREGNEVVFLNELRHQYDTALQLRFSINEKNLLAVRAVSGIESVSEGVDYRGKPVIGALRSIAGTNWFIVVKVDKEEAFASFRHQALTIIILFAVLVMLAGGSAYLIYFFNQSQGRKKAVMEANVLNKELEQKVLERTDQLERTVAELQAANKNLEAFSYSVSHDLRAPLRGIDGFSQALLEDYQDSLSEQGQEYLHRLRAAAQRMGLLIEDLLQLSKVTLSQMNLSAIDMSNMAQDIGNELQKENPDNHVDFIVAPGISGYGDPRLIRIVLYNLLANAWKFTGKCRNPRIEFRACEDDGMQTFYVLDNGVGFDMKYVDKLFLPFQRLHSERDYPGTGIGLATVERIVRSHGGSVGAESKPGVETIFKFSLRKGGKR
jgi:signal transduction histidine kinase